MSGIVTMDEHWAALEAEGYVFRLDGHVLSENADGEDFLECLDLERCYSCGSRVFVVNDMPNYPAEYLGIATYCVTCKRLSLNSEARETAEAIAADHATWCVGVAASMKSTPSRADEIWEARNMKILSRAKRESSKLLFFRFVEEEINRLRHLAYQLRSNHD